MDWTSENTLKFVHAYGKHPCLWDPTHPQRINRFRRTEAWHAIKKELGDLCTLEELRKKKECLMATYRLCKAKVMRSETESKYEPSWFAYLAMDVFLGWIYETCPTPSMKTETNGYDTENSDCYYQEESRDSNDNSAAKDVKKEPNDAEDNTEDKNDLAAHSSETKFDWSHENILKFLKLYRRNSCLWDPSHPDNGLVRCRTKAWNAIKKELNADCTIEELKKKKEILIGTYRRFKRKELQSYSPDDPPDWYAYSLIDSFLAPIYKSPRAFILRIENKDRNRAHSSSDDENVKKKLNFVNKSALTSQYPLQLQAEQANRDLNYDKDAQNDSEDDQPLAAHCAETQTHWPNEKVLRFLELYQKYPCLWDPESPKRKNKRYRNKAWLAIKKELGHLYTLDDLKKKKEMMMCTYIRCKRKMVNTDNVYQPSWYAFPVMDGFLGSISKKTESKDCVTDQSSEDDEDVNNPENSQNDTEDKQRTTSRHTETAIDWTKENIIQFIELFQKFPCLWDPMDPDYIHRRRRNKAWLSIKKALRDQFTVNELRKRKDMLLCTYKRCKKNAEEMESKNCVYEPTWFAFYIMDSFLDSIDKCPVAFMRTEDKDHNTSNSCYNDEDVKRYQNLYTSLPLTNEDPLELMTENPNSNLKYNCENDAQSDKEDETQLTTHCTETQMDWSNENVLKFLEIFRDYPGLWDPTNHERSDKQYISKAWHLIKKKLEDRCTVEELKKKKDSLLAMYRRCKKKLIETGLQPSWFAFTVIDEFLGSIYKCQDTQKPREVSKTNEGKQHISADSSNYQEEECDSNTNSDPEKWKEENYVIIVTPPEPQRENPLELPIKLDDRVVNSSIKYEIQNDSDDEQDTADCTPMNWSNEDVLRFIKLYKGHPCLWDPTHPWRRSKQRIANAWNTIKTDLGDRCTVEELKKKKESLLSMYRALIT